MRMKGHESRTAEGNRITNETNMKTKFGEVKKIRN